MKGSEHPRVSPFIFESQLQRKGKGCNILTIITHIYRQTISDQTNKGAPYVLLEHLQSRMAKSAHDLSKSYLESAVLRDREIRLEVSVVEGKSGCFFSRLTSVNLSWITTTLTHRTEEALCIVEMHKG